VLVPGNFAWALWGWPNRFAARMRDAGSEIILLGPYESGDPGTRGIDSAEEISLIPAGFDGYVWTNRIEIIGPMLKPDTRLRIECFQLGADGGEGC
jgi:glycerophosphoryl diester phosphodiesterase